MSTSVYAEIIIGVPLSEDEAMKIFGARFKDEIRKKWWKFKFW